MREKSSRWRALPWLPTILGVVVLVVLVIVAAVRLTPWRVAPRALPPPAPAFTLPGTLSGPPVAISLIPTTGLPTTSPIPTTSPPTTSPIPTAGPTPPRPSATPARPTPPPAVSGRYHVLDAYPDSFIGEVLLTNGTGTPQSWTVRLTYPDHLVTSWLESLPQPTLSRTGATFTWTSSVPLAAGASAQMRFHFDGTSAPSSCRVNGSPCS